MAVEFTPSQKNAMRVIERVISGGETYSYQKAIDRTVFREYLAALRDQNLDMHHCIYPHSLPLDALRAALNWKDASARLDLVSAVLSMSHPPRPNAGEDRVILEALTAASRMTSAPSALPLLHEKGFRLAEKEKASAAARIGTLLRCNIWPHVELIAPNLLWKFGGGLVGLVVDPENTPQRNGISTKGALALLEKIECPEDMSEQVSREIARRSERLIRFAMLPDYPEIKEAMVWLMQKGWLHTTIVRESAAGKKQGSKICEFLAEVEAEHLSQSAPQAPGARQGLRL